MKKRTKRIFIVGIAVILLGSSYKPGLLFLFGEKVPGYVVKIETPAHWYSGPASYYPVVRFLTRDSLPESFRVGSQFDYRSDFMDEVEVLYLPFYPEMAQVNEFDSLWDGFFIKTILCLIVWIAFFTSFNDFFEKDNSSTFQKFRNKYNQLTKHQ